MARNSDLIVTAGLNVDASVGRIQKELDHEVSPKLKLEIACTLNTEDISGLQRQLREASKGLQLNIDSNISKIIDDKTIKNQAKALSDALDLAIPRGKTQEVREELQRLIDEYQQAFQSGNFDAITKSFCSLESYADKFRKEIVDVNQELVDTQQQVKELARQGKVFVSESVFGELKYLLDGGKNASSKLTQAFGVGGWTKDITKATTSWDSKVQQLNDIFDTSRISRLTDIDDGRFSDHTEGILQLVEYLNTSFDRGTELVKEYGDQMDAEFGDKLYSALNKVLGLSSELDERWTTIFNPDEVREATHEVEKLGVEIEKSIGNLPSIGVGGDTQSTLERAKSTLNQFFESESIDGKANRIKRAIEDTTGGLQRFYVQVERGDKSVETLTYALNEQGNAYEYLGKVIREADNSTDFRRKDVETQWQIQSEKLIQFVNNADKAGLASTTLKEDIKELFESLNKANPNFGGDTSTMNAFLDKFDIAKAKMQAFNTEARKENATANLQNRIKRLTADVNAYGEANERATKSMKQMSNGKTFAVEWSRITTEMARGADLTDRELKDLSADMAVFRKEAQAAGLAGESAFGKFANSFKVMSSYITANMVFNFVKRQLHDMVQEVTAVDTAMVELRKVTEATDEQFEAFAISAGKTGRELGASVSDVINATSTFSRAGYNLPDAEELGKIATLYKNVGDGINIDTASESLISVMKAFNIEAKDSVSVIDKINDVSNKAAIESGGLGLALQRVASAMKASQNTLDETIAIITASNEIVENPEMVANGWRTVALRIRGAKTELEQAGEDTEGMVESTAKLRDLFKGISGVDIMLDENTFKSTYQIITELGKVWHNISDINQASLLEAIAGKRQSNIVAAALDNYERLDEILKISESSAGSAMREQEEYAKSIQYSIDTLKAAYQDFADSVINSDFVKNLLGTAQSFLEVLTKIIDKFGTLPTILTGITAIGGIKGVGIFSNLDNEFKVTTEKIKDFKQILSYDFGSLYKKYNISLANISPEELQTLQTYVNTLGVAENRTASYNDILKDSSDLVKRQATNFTSLYESYRRGEISLNQYQTATQNLALTQKTAAATSKALSLALNTIVNVGTMVLINLAIQGISKLADKLIVTKEELAEMRQETLNSLDSLKQGIESLSDRNQEVEQLLSNYKELVSSTNDTSEVKDQLIEIQGQLIDKFGEEAENLDLLNDKYDTTIEKIKSLSDAEETEWHRQHAAEIKRVEDIRNLNVSADTLAKQSEYTGQSGETRALYKPTSSVTPNKDLVTELYLIEDINRNARWAAESIDGILASKMSFWDNNDAIILTGTIEEARQQLGLLIDTYKQADDADAETLDVLTTRYNELGKAIEDVNTWASQDKLTKSFTGTSNAIGTITTTAVSQLAEINAEADNISAKWFENFGEMQKGSLKTIDTIKAALQTIASGDLLSSDDFWALAEIDTDKVLNGAQLINNQFKLSEEQLIQLKDTYIKKQIDTIKAENADLAVKKQQTDELIRQAELEVQALGRRGLSNSAYRTEFEKANEQLRQSKQYSKEYGDSITRNNILIQQLNGSLGNTVDYQKALSDRQKKLNDEISRLNKEADNLLKAQEYVIDQRIKDNENEKKALEDEKKLLEEQLDVLEHQQSELEDMIENYKSIAGVVEDKLGKSIENLKKQQEAEENAVQAKIDALKESREQQDEENSLLEKELELKEKLANLDKAKSTKVKTFSSARGWHFDVDREAVANAEEEVRAAQKSYDDAVADKAYKDQEKALEQEKDVISKNYEAEIKAYEDYIQQYKDVLEEETIAENERLAEQILGADWREKISKRDVELLGKFRNEYRSHNNALKTLVNTELAMTKASIEAKDAEIKAKQEQIDAWNQYKTDVQQAAQDIKNANEDYMNYINSVVLPDEANNFVQREINLWNFKENYKAYMDEITSKQAELDSVADSLTNLQDIANGFDLGDLISNLERMTDQFGNALLTVDEFEKMWEDTYEKQKRMGMINSASAAYVMGSHSEGGVADYTGLAMLHGTKQKSETIFNANDSAKLYDMIHNTPNLMADMVSKAVKISRPTIANNSTTNNPIFNIQRMEINGVQNPKEFTEAFNKNIEAYWKTKLTENRVK